MPILSRYDRLSALRETQTVDRAAPHGARTSTHWCRVR